VTRKSDIFTSACGLAVALVLCACTAGCDRAPEKAAPAPVAVQPAASPSDDAAYQAQLQGTMADRKKRLEALARVNARLRAMEDRARAALPSNATPEQVRAKIRENPVLDQAYRELENARAESQAAAKDFSQAQKLIRAHHTQRQTAQDRAQGAATAEK
jgi:hypothetical protein